MIAQDCAMFASDSRVTRVASHSRVKIIPYAQPLAMRKCAYAQSIATTLLYMYINILNKRRNIISVISLTILLQWQTRQCNIYIFLKLSKLKIFSRNVLTFFLFLLQNIDCGYPHSMFWSKNKKHRNNLAYPSFTILKWGSRGYTLHGQYMMVLVLSFGLSVVLHVQSQGVPDKTLRNSHSRHCQVNVKMLLLY